MYMFIRTFNIIIFYFYLVFVHANIMPALQIFIHLHTSAARNYTNGVKLIYLHLPCIPNQPELNTDLNKTHTHK